MLCKGFHWSCVSTVSSLTGSRFFVRVFTSKSSIRENRKIEKKNENALINCSNRGSMFTNRNSSRIGLFGYAILGLALFVLLSFYFDFVGFIFHFLSQRLSSMLLLKFLQLRLSKLKLSWCSWWIVFAFGLATKTLGLIDLATYMDSPERANSDTSGSSWNWRNLLNLDSGPQPQAQTSLKALSPYLSRGHQLGRKWRRGWM